MRGRILLALLFGLGIALSLPARPALAHATLSATDPASNTVVPKPPNRITLTFTEAVQPVKGRIQVLAPDNSRADTGEPTASGGAVTITVGARAQGTYLVSYRVISADSHPIAGSFTFSVGAPSTRQDDGAAAASPARPSVQAAISITKTVGYAGLLLTVGPIMVLSLLWPGRLSRTGPGRLIWTGLGLVAASTVAGLYLQAPYTTGGGLADVRLADLQDVLSSRYGAVMLVRLGVLCAAAFLIRPLVASSVQSRSDYALVGVIGLAALATWPLTGHPVASPVAGVSIMVDVVHLAAMAVWLGGLTMLVAFLLRRCREYELRIILPIWSRWATVAVTALTVAGVVQALITIGDFGALISSSYGRLLLVKVALVGVIIAAAACSRRLVFRRLDQGRSTLLLTVGAELGVAAMVLGLTAVLVQTTPPRAVAATSPKVNRVEQTLRSASGSLQLTFFPAVAGNNTVHLYAYGADGKALPVVEWRGTVALPQAGIEPIGIPLLRITDNHAIGDVGMPRAGQWQLRFTLRTTEIDQETLTGTVTVR